MPLRLLYLLDHADLGGGETSFLNFAAELRRRRPDLELHVNLVEAGPLESRLAQLGLTVHRLPYPRLFRRGPVPWFSRSAGIRLAHLISELQPVLVHANNVFGMVYGGYAARRARPSPVPLLWTCHGVFDIDTLPKQLAARRWPRHIFCVSQAIREEVLRHVPDPARSSVDYLGVPPFTNDTPAENRPRLRNAVREAFQLGGEVPLIAVVGRFQPVKGHQYLLDALAAVWPRIPNLQVWLIGDALFGSAEESAHKAMIERRVAEEAPPGRVQFLGFRDDARRLMRALDALVIPSEAESFSMVAAEALEAGIPVIGPDGGGPREIIAEPQCGLRFTPRDSAQLAERILQALLQEGPGAQFDPAVGPRRFQELFTIQSHVERGWEQYRHLAPQLGDLHPA